MSSDQPSAPYDDQLLGELFGDDPAPSAPGRAPGRAPRLSSDGFFDNTATGADLAWASRLSALSGIEELDQISHDVSEGLFDDEPVAADEAYWQAPRRDTRPDDVPVDNPVDVPVAASLTATPPEAADELSPPAPSLAVPSLAVPSLGASSALCPDCSAEPTRWEVISHRLWIAAAVVVGSVGGITFGLLGFAGWLGYTEGWQAVTDFLPTRAETSESSEP